MKGHTNNPNGRKRGVPNKVTGSLREMICAFLSENWQQAKLDYKALEPKERLAFYEKMLAYGLPKPAPEQQDQEPEKDDASSVFEKVNEIIQRDILRNNSTKLLQ